MAPSLTDAQFLTLMVTGYGAIIITIALATLALIKKLS